MTVAIVDYGSGNLHSAAKAFERAVRTKHKAYDHCSVLLMERPDLGPEDRTRVDAFRNWVSSHSICHFDADRSNRVAHEVRDRDRARSFSVSASAGQVDHVRMGGRELQRVLDGHDALGGIHLRQ